MHFLYGRPVKCAHHKLVGIREVDQFFCCIQHGADADFLADFPHANKRFAKCFGGGESD